MRVNDDIFGNEPLRVTTIIVSISFNNYNLERELYFLPNLGRDFVSETLNLN